MDVFTYEEWDVPGFRRFFFLLLFCLGFAVDARAQVIPSPGPTPLDVRGGSGECTTPSGMPPAHRAEALQATLARYMTKRAMTPGDTPVVQVVYLVPSDRVENRRYAQSLDASIRYLQEWYSTQLPGGNTFRLAEPPVLTVQSGREEAWYRETPNGDPFVTFWNNVIQDGLALMGNPSTTSRVWLFYADADPGCGQCSGCGAGNRDGGFVVIGANDLRGFLGGPWVRTCEGDVMTYGFRPCRFVGGMGHEVGHAFGLPHPPGCEAGLSSCDADALMWTGVYRYPDTYLTATDKQLLTDHPFFSPQSFDGIFPSCDAFVPFDVPYLLEPHDGRFAGLTPWLVWGDVEEASWHTVEVATDASFSSVVYTKTTNDEWLPFTDPGLSTVYYWRVGHTPSGPWSEVRSFLTDPSAPVERPCDGDFSLATQAEVDAFACAEVTGKLSIGPSSDISSLDRLSALTVVGGDLNIIDNETLTSLDGLSALIVVGGDLDLGNNHALPSLSGLSALTSVGGSLSIGNNHRLPSLDGLSELTDVGGDLNISDNDALTSLDGPPALTSVEGDLNIRDNDALTSLDGLLALTDVGGALNIGNNQRLQSLDGLLALTSVGGNLDISDNEALTSLNGLSALTDVRRDLIIGSNTALQSLDGLLALTDVGGNLNITDNTALTNLDGLSALTAVTGSLDITANETLTSLDGLSALTTVTGSLNIGNNQRLQSLNGLLALTSVGGNLDVSDNTALLSLTGLSALTAVTGNVFIGRNVALASLTGLSALSSVGGNLNMSDNTALTGLTGLSALTAAEGNVFIGRNVALTSLDGLSGLTDVEESLHISGNEALTSLDGLSALTSVGGDLNIGNNTALQSLDGLSVLADVGKDLSISGNETLTSLDGLSALSAVDGDLNISYNSALTSLDGLSGITFVGGALYIGRNDALTNLDGLSALTAVEGNLNISDNDALSRCNCGLLDLLKSTSNGITGTITIQNNAPGCNSEAEIVALGTVGCTTGVALEGTAGLPEVFALEPNYPNPFTDGTTLHFALPEASVVRLVVYDAAGRVIARLVDGPMAAGHHRVTWQAGALPSGMYVYRLTAGAYTEARTMMLLR